MKNKKLKQLVKNMKHIEILDVQVLSTKEELSILGGSCPMLTSCETYTNCAVKFKDSSDTGTIDMPFIIKL